MLCWTPDGAIAPEHCTRDTGGTGQAIRVAGAHGVRVFNLARPEHRARVEGLVAGEALLVPGL